MAVSFALLEGLYRKRLYEAQQLLGRWVVYAREVEAELRECDPEADRKIARLRDRHGLPPHD